MTHGLGRDHNKDSNLNPYCDYNLVPGAYGMYKSETKLFEDVCIFIEFYANFGSWGKYLQRNFLQVTIAKLWNHNVTLFWPYGS